MVLGKSCWSLVLGKAIMKFSFCHSENTRVTDSRSIEDNIAICRHCAGRFTTKFMDNKGA